MDKNEFLILLNNNHRGLARGLFTDYDRTVVDAYVSLVDSGEITAFHGFVCNVSGRVSDNKYALVPYTGTYQELQDDPAFTEYHSWRAVAEKKNCHMCGKIYFAADEKDNCPYCKNQL